MTTLRTNFVCFISTESEPFLCLILLLENNSEMPAELLQWDDPASYQTLAVAAAAHSLLQTFQIAFRKKQLFLEIESGGAAVSSENQLGVAEVKRFLTKLQNHKRQVDSAGTNSKLLSKTAKNIDHKVLVFTFILACLQTWKQQVCCVSC